VRQRMEAKPRSNSIIGLINPEPRLSSRIQDKTIEIKNWLQSALARSKWDKEGAAAVRAE
jgi:hypothetical protein